MLVHVRRDKAARDRVPQELLWSPHRRRCNPRRAAESLHRALGPQCRLRRHRNARRLGGQRTLLHAEVASDVRLTHPAPRQEWRLDARRHKRLSEPQTPPLETGCPRPPQGWVRPSPQRATWSSETMERPRSKSSTRSCNRLKSARQDQMRLDKAAHTGAQPARAGQDRTRRGGITQPRGGDRQPSRKIPN